MLFNYPLCQRLMLSAFLFVGLTFCADSRIVDNGRLAVVDGINHYVGGVPVSKLSPVPVVLSNVDADADIIPITVIQSKAQHFSSDDLQQAILNFTRDDDVFQRAFLQAIFMNYIGTGSGHLTLNRTSTAKSLKNSILMASPSYHVEDGALTASLDSDIPQGPYFLITTTGALYRAFRLYADHQLTFTQPALGDERGGFMPLPAVTEGAMTQSVAVPSRLYYTPTAEKPLADIFHLKGLRTSGGNRAFHDFYPPQNKTGSAVQRLIDAGAVIVGKMGTVQFANGDNPTADWVDFHCPFNPRGDGYQSPGGSSSGPAAGIASYPWLDIAVGSDTGGSMRDPAGKNGVFGNRPSYGAVGTDGVLPLCDALDSVGVFTRDARVWNTVLHAWYKGSGSSPASNSNPTVSMRGHKGYPKRLFYSSDSFPDKSTAAGEILESVVQKIEDFLGVKREVVSTISRWEESHPRGAPSDITELLNTTYAVLTSVYQYENLALPFMNAYSAAHSGPYGALNNETCSEGIYIYPYSLGKTMYRNTYPDAPTEPPMGFKDGRIASLAGVPDFVVPVGEVGYNSTVSLRTEYMPVALSFVAAVGCDLMMSGLIRELQEEGVVRAVGTGSRVYP
ncbi:hypothetical protein BDV06DRAFT_233459 [Aspergillus oleicola]